MDGDQERGPSVAEALREWRDAERNAVRATAQREAAEVAAESAQLAERAAQATADAAGAARVAAEEASNAATATAEAAHKVVIATRSEGEARRILERQAIVAEDGTRAAHHAARDRAEARQRAGRE